MPFSPVKPSSKVELTSKTAGQILLDLHSEIHLTMRSGINESFFLYHGN